MKQDDDVKTVDLFEMEKRPRGRPVKPDALSGAERARLFRERQKAAGIKIARVPQNVLDEAAKQLRKVKAEEQRRTFTLESAHAEIRNLVEKLAEKDAEIIALKRSGANVVSDGCRFERRARMDLVRRS